MCWFVCGFYACKYYYFIMKVLADFFYQIVGWIILIAVRVASSANMGMLVNCRKISDL